MTQDSENWQRLQALFHLAEVTPAEDRERVLAAQCTDPELLRRAMTIFNAANAQEANDVPAGAPPLNGKIGPYSPIRHIGSGGIGSVYLVERILGGAVQRCALKMLAPHAAGPSFISRFHREQHILASLEHPNITRMLDAGLSESGQPYLAMEYVEGGPFTAYCDMQNLGIQERLQLFLRVCDAVAYAHRNLVIHLDLKPSNILVTPDGTVKLLDFGTSKLIQPDSLLTTTVMATPAYASPEQLRNEAVTTACDVYSLGAILFELLSGRRPGDKASVAIMIERAMKEEEPEHLQDAVTGPAAKCRGVSEHRLRLMLSGDLATIVAKCLSPRPRDRYLSVDSLTVDIQRYLDGRPILGRPQTTFCRVSKFVRRNRKIVALGAVSALVLVTVLVYAEWRQQQALREGQRAEHMQTFLYRLFKLANSNYTGKPAATVPEFLELGVKVLPEYIKDPSDLRKAQMSLAESMYENGDLDHAQQVFTQTTASAKAAGDIGAEAESEAFSGDIAYLHGQMGVGQGLTADALRLSRERGVPPSVRAWSEIYYASNREKNGFLSDENLRLLESAVRECQDHHLSERETAYAIYMLAEDFEGRGRLDDAEHLIGEDIAIYSHEPYAMCDQSQMYEDLGYIEVSRGNIEASLPLYQTAYDGLKACSGPDAKNTLMVQDLLAGAMLRLGQAKTALPMLEASLPAWKKIAGSSPDLFVPMYYLSRAYVQTGRYSEGETVAKELAALLEGKIRPTDRRIGVTQMVWARALAGQHLYQEALPHAEIASRVLVNGAVPYTKQLDSEAHQVLLDLQSKLAQR